MADQYRETLTVRYRDMDAQGHMFFANYLVLADEVAGHYMETLGFDWSHPDKFPCLVFTANVNCDYLEECHAGDQVSVTVGYERIGNSSATLGFFLTRQADQCTLAKGSFTQVFVDKESRRPITVPDNIRACMSRHTP
jgi:acyl-CoA thioester hydrolase